MEQRIEKYMEIAFENQIAIKNLTNIVEKTSKDIDKLVEKQNEILIGQEEMKRLNDRLSDNEKRITRIESVILWMNRSFIGGAITIIVGTIVYKLTRG